MALYTDNLKNVEKLEKEQHYLQFFGETVFDNQKHLKTISLHHQYIFHPLKYLYHLVKCCQKKNVQFYEHSRVDKIIKRKKRFSCLCTRTSYYLPRSHSCLALSFYKKRFLLFKNVSIFRKY